MNVPLRSWTISEFLARIANEIGLSDWFLIDQRRINQFAVVTEDDAFIHTDPEQARLSAFGGTIAHGYLTLSLLSAMLRSAIPAVEGAKITLNYGFEKVRFLAPVPSGSRVRARFTLSSLSEKGADRWLMAFAIVIEIEGSSKTALVADWLTMVLT